MVLVHSAKIAMAKAIINHRHCHHAGGQRHYQGKDQEFGTQYMAYDITAYAWLSSM
jgi:hypothetical protein